MVASHAYVRIALKIVYLLLVNQAGIALADGIVEVDTKRVSVVHNFKSLILKLHQLEVSVDGVVYFKVHLSSIDDPHPSIEHIKNFFDLKAKEALKIAAPLLIERSRHVLSTVKHAYQIENMFGMQDPTSMASAKIQSELVVSPTRVRVMQDSKTRAVIVRVDGLEIVRREHGHETSIGALDTLYQKIITELEQARTEHKFVEITLASQMWESLFRRELLNPITKSAKPELNDNQLREQRRSFLLKERQLLVDQLKKIDLQMGRVEARGINADSEGYRGLVERRDKMVKDLSKIDAQLTAIEEMLAPTGDDPPSSGRRHTEVGPSRESLPKFP